MKTKNIEVEIRGNLTEDDYNKLKTFMDENGKHVESHEREMFLLKDYDGFTEDFVGRDVDIRLRNTSGNCEIMMKTKAGDAREEISVPLKGNDLESIKKVVKALGCKRAMWMHRLKEVYEYNGIEWSLVICPKNFRYYEAEMVAQNEDEVSEINKKLETEAKKLNLQVLDDEGTRELIHRLDTQVNKMVDL